MKIVAILSMVVAGTTTIGGLAPGLFFIGYDVKADEHNKYKEI